MRNSFAPTATVTASTATFEPVDTSIGAGSGRVEESSSSILPRHRSAFSVANETSPPDAQQSDKSHAAYATVTALNVKAKRQPRVQIRARWEGTVTELSDDSFFASLTNQDDMSEPRELAEFDNSILSDDDMNLLAVGAVFYFSVGYRTDEKGTRSAFSEVRLRRVPVWTSKELDAIRTSSEVDELFE